MSDFGGKGSKLLAGKWQFWAQFPTLRRSWRLLCAGSPTVSRRAVRQSRVWRQRRQRRQQRLQVNRRHRLCSSSLAPVQTKLVKVIRRRASLQSNFTLLLVKSQFKPKIEQLWVLPFLVRESVWWWGNFLSYAETTILRDIRILPSTLRLLWCIFYQKPVTSL